MTYTSMSLLHVPEDFERDLGTLLEVCFLKMSTRHITSKAVSRLARITMILLFEHDGVTLPYSLNVEVLSSYLSDESVATMRIVSRGYLQPNPPTDFSGYVRYLQCGTSGGRTKSDRSGGTTTKTRRDLFSWWTRTIGTA